jgi:hypothetical protein
MCIFHHRLESYLSFSIKSMYPPEKIAVVSEKTKVLDLIAIILHQEGLICIQYDGRVSYER